MSTLPVNLDQFFVIRILRLFTLISSLKAPAPKKNQKFRVFQTGLCYIPKSKHRHQSGESRHAQNATINILLSLITKMVSNSSATAVDHHAQMLSTSLAATS